MCAGWSKADVAIGGEQIGYTLKWPMKLIMPKHLPQSDGSSVHGVEASVLSSKRIVAPM